MFKVRKDSVIAALKCLVKYNSLFQEYKVVTNESNLNWMGDQKEAIFPVMDTVVEIGNDDSHDDGDLGPSTSQTLTEEIHAVDADYEVMGGMENDENYIPSEEDK